MLAFQGRLMDVDNIKICDFSGKIILRGNAYTRKQHLLCINECEKKRKCECTYLKYAHADKFASAYVRNTLIKTVETSNMNRQ